MAIIFPKIAAIRMWSAYRWNTMAYGHGEKINWPICAIGIAVAEDGKVLPERTVAELVRPWQPFQGGKMPLSPDHGLKWSELSGAPSFTESAYFRIAEVASYCPVVAFHNARDAVIKLDRLCSRYSLEHGQEEDSEAYPAFPPFRATEWRCTYKAAARIAKEESIAQDSEVVQFDAEKEMAQNSPPVIDEAPDSFNTLLEAHGITAEAGIGGEAEALAQLAVVMFEQGSLCRYQPDRFAHRYPSADPTSWCIQGYSFCITGSLDSMPRAEAYARIKKGGGTKVDGVSAITDFLVIGNGSKGASGKKKEAKKYQDMGSGIQVVTEPQFLEMLRKSNV